MRTTPDELYEMEMEAYRESLANYQRSVAWAQGCGFPLHWLHKPEPPVHPAALPTNHAGMKRGLSAKVAALRNSRR